MKTHNDFFFLSRKVNEQVATRYLSGNCKGWTEIIRFTARGRDLSDFRRLESNNQSGYWEVIHPNRRQSQPDVLCASVFTVSDIGSATRLTTQRIITSSKLFTHITHTGLFVVVDDCLAFGSDVSGLIANMTNSHHASSAFSRMNHCVIAVHVGDVHFSRWPLKPTQLATVREGK